MSIFGKSDEAKRKKHPIYRVRLALFAVSDIGLLLTLLSIPAAGDSIGAIIYSIIVFVLTDIFVLYDLVFWGFKAGTLKFRKRGGRIALPTSSSEALLAHHAAADDGDGDNRDGDPKWPRAHILFFDGVLLILQELAFWTLVFSWGRHERNYPPGFALFTHAWAALFAAGASALHGVSFYRQWKARQDKKLMSRLVHARCRRCGNQVDGHDGGEGDGLMGGGGSGGDGDGGLHQSRYSNRRAGDAERERETFPHRGREVATPTIVGASRRDGSAMVMGDAASDGSGDARMIIVPDEREVAAAQAHEPLWAGSKGDLYASRA